MNPNSMSPAFSARRIDTSDMRVIALTFIATASIVLAVSVAADCVLLSIVLAGVRRMADVPAFRLAADLLPSALLFTAVLTGITGVAITWAYRRVASPFAPPTLPQAAYRPEFA